MTREELNQKYPELEGVPMHRHPHGGGWVSDDSDVDQDSFVSEDSTVEDSTVEDSVITDGSIVGRSSYIANSTVESSTVKDGSRVERSSVIRSRIEDSAVEGSAVEGSAVEGSTVNHSRMEGSVVKDGSRMERSVVKDGSRMERSVVIRSYVERSRVIRSTVERSTVNHSRMEGSVVKSGSRVEDSTVEKGNFIPPEGAEEGFLRILDANPGEVPALRKALMEGKVNGSVYEGKCCCLIGTIAKAKGCGHRALNPDADNPEERMFLAIRPGQKPGNGNVGSMAAKLAVEWIDQWTEKQ